MVQVTLKSPPKSFPTFPSIDSFHWSSWRRKDCHDCHDGWCFISSISIIIYRCIFTFSSLPGNISQQKSEVLPRKLTWNLKMKVWKMSFPLKGVIFRFHVSFRGSIFQGAGCFHGVIFPICSMMPSLEAISFATIPIQKIATSRCTVRFLPNGDSSYKINWLVWVVLSLLTRRYNFAPFIS